MLCESLLLNINLDDISQRIQKRLIDLNVAPPFGEPYTAGEFK